MRCFTSNYFAFAFGPQFRDHVAMAPIDTSSASGPAVNAWVVNTKFGNALLGQLCMRKGMPHRSAAAGAERHTEPAVIGPTLKYTSYMHVGGPTARSHQMRQGLRCCKFGEIKDSPDCVQIGSWVRAALHDVGDEPGVSCQAELRCRPQHLH